jgi:thiol:disulfide interchange protein DsbD
MAPFFVALPLMRTTVAASLARAHRMIRCVLLSVPAAVACVGASEAQQTPARDPSPHSHVELVSESSTIVPGGTATVAVRLTLDPRWHTYWLNPGDAGLPLTVKWRLPEGVTVGALQFPTPRLTPQPPLMSYGYEDEVFVLAEVSLPAAFAGRTLTIAGKADWLACAEVCLPATGPLSLTLTVGSTRGASTQWADAIARARASVPAVLAGYRATAWADSARYILALVRDAASTTTPFAVPYVFADSADVLDHAAAQRVAQTPDTLVFALVRAAADSTSAARLSGIIATDIDAIAPRSYAFTAAVDAAPPAPLRSAALALLGTATSVGGVSAVAATDAVLPAPADMSLMVAIAFAFVGGLLLNLMPCVFPVLSVKVLALLQHGGGEADASRSRTHGLAFGLGVLLSFWILAGALIALRAGGESLGWGFQLQSPPVVAVLALLMFALGLNLSGVFEIGLSLTRLGGAGGGGGYGDSLLTGGLAVLVAAPCTAPFMGAALGFALVQPAIIGLLVFTALAMGLALPFMVLASAPQLLRSLPRPGPWLETLKQLFAFPMYATVVWLLWVLGQQAGVNAIAAVLMAMIVVALGAWLWARGVRSENAPTRALSVALMLFAGVGSVMVTKDATPPAVAAPVASSGALEWLPWSATTVRDQRAAGRPVFVDFTAAWCLSCQVNERVALRTGAVSTAFRKANVALVRADWTSRDDGITQVLASFGRSGVPLYVLYPANPNAAPVILPAVLTPGMVVDAVTRAAAPTRIAAGLQVR